jgi:hypothetical protein
MPGKHTLHGVFADARSTSRSTALLPRPTDSVTDRSHPLPGDLAAAKAVGVGLDAGRVSADDGSLRRQPGCGGQVHVLTAELSASDRCSGLATLRVARSVAPLRWWA